MKKGKLSFLIVFLFSLALFLSGCSSTPTDPINQSPDADFSANPTSGGAPLTVTFDAANSSDSDGSIASYEWDFGDGSEETVSVPTIDHTFDNSGNYDVELTVRDDDGASDSAIETVEVKGDTDPSYFEFNESTNTITGYDTDGPKDVVIPSEINDVDVEVIGEEACNRMYHLNSVGIPDSVTVIEKEAFRANQLDSVDIGNSVEEIKGASFNTNYLTEVDIPDSVTLIGEDAFTGNNLISVEIGDGVDVHSEAFDGDFKEAYEDNNKSGGVYKRESDDSNNWYKE